MGNSALPRSYWSDFLPRIVSEATHAFGWLTLNRHNFPAFTHGSWLALAIRCRVAACTPESFATCPGNLVTVRRIARTDSFSSISPLSLVSTCCCHGNQSRAALSTDHDAPFRLPIVSNLNE